jgi:acetylornithine deacetylase/succinyl-diaminopimelate desuccinylase-like protein
MQFKQSAVAATLVLGWAVAGFAQSASTPGDQLAHDILKQLVEIDTTHGAGITAASQAMATRLIAEGFPALDVRLAGASPRNQNLVARLHGTGARRPLLLLAHLDVVEARREDWTMDPFTMIEQDGYFYGRGTGDDKAMAAVWIATLLTLKREGYVPDRDLVVALTADEEGWGPDNGVRWLLQNERGLIDAEFCLNEGGGGLIKDGRYLLNEVQAAEKVYANFRLEARNKGGHSSLPVKDNAIYHLAGALSQLAAFDFPVHLTEVTRAYFERTAAIVSGQPAADMKAVLAATPDAQAVARLATSPLYNSTMRTTCVATTLEGGHAENALPQMARANVNCRIIPGEEPADIRRTIEQVIDDPAVTVTPVSEVVTSAPSPLRPDLMTAVEELTTEMWHVPVVPTMSTGGTDGTFLRNAGIPTYGVSGLFEDVDDARWHGRDERIGAKQFYESRLFLERLVRALSSSAAGLAKPSIPTTPAKPSSGQNGA